MTPEQRLTAHRRAAATAEEAGWIAWRLGNYRGAIGHWMAAAQSTIAARKLSKEGGR